ncbi:respiratory-chain NADH dehydrogenase [Ascobolus immersus RN42]|uniref:Respiratory-chain NADH dehydrogenase n=1 Tax=Ascobolus immersus RN42 TaxID=1160509 RepID=A0A3N4HDN1_ASCIM|nr:respiratory-chain NADH dehydrogenase [Ascobolus immersus RN42]
MFLLRRIVADALKLILKEYVSPTQANLILFFLGPLITLIFSLLGYAVIPFGPGLSISDYNLANSKYAFLGSLRSTAQLISYELILSSAILLIILFTGALAETNRAPMDLAEAESELVSGFFTEHAAAIFVFFFLAEYASIVLICYLYPFSSLISSFDSPLLEGALYGVVLGIKTCVLVFMFVWVRASFPRIRYDSLMTFC